MLLYVCIFNVLQTLPSISYYHNPKGNDKKLPLFTAYIIKIWTILSTALYTCGENKMLSYCQKPFKNTSVIEGRKFFWAF